MSRSGYNPRHSGRIVTIERTSKALKLRVVLYGLAMLVAGVVAVCNWPTDVARASEVWWWSCLVSAVAGCLWLVTRARIWWNHA